jgi:2-oxoglutarate ferredoxin oxidoreductase subunit beta
VREHIEATSTLDFVPEMAEITTSYAEGSMKKVKMHDGSFIQLNKLSQDWDPLNKRSAMNAIMDAKEKGEILTGLLYMNPETRDLHHTLDTNELPLNTLGPKELCPGSEVLKNINAEFR